MLRSVFGKSLRDQRRSLLGWIIGITVVGAIYAAFYPTINNPEMMRALDAYPQGLLDAIGFTDITSAAGYVGSTTYGLLGPALIIVFAAAAGVAAIAGDEDAGRLDLILAHPVARWSVLLQRFAAIVVGMFLACAVLAVTLIVISGPAQLDSIGPANLVAASVQLALLGVLFAALALAIGAATGRRTIAYAVVAIVAVGGYLANNLAPTIEGLGWLADLSPFRYAIGGEPLRDGLQVADAAILAIAAGVLVAIGGVLFDRRDVAV